MSITNREVGRYLSVCPFFLVVSTVKFSFFIHLSVIGAHRESSKRCERKREGHIHRGCCPENIHKAHGSKAKAAAGFTSGKMRGKAHSWATHTVKREKRYKHFSKSTSSKVFRSRLSSPRNTRNSRRAPSRISKSVPALWIFHRPLGTTTWQRPGGGGAHRKLAEWRRLGDADRRASLDAIADIVRPRWRKPPSRNISSKVRSRISTIAQPDPFPNAMMWLISQHNVHGECHWVGAALEAVHFLDFFPFRSFIVDHHIYLAMQTTSASRAHKVNATDNLSHLRSCYWLGFESCPRYGRIRSAYSL